ncbi:hypothetical protein Tco_0043455, partial [Tanacetum coccineum]
VIKLIAHQIEPALLHSSEFYETNPPNRAAQVSLTSAVINVKFSLVPSELGPSCRCARTELITLDLICPSTYQLLRNSGGDSGPDLSFEKSASSEHLFSSSHVSLAEAS